MPRATILVVCTANVCRSPRAEFVLREAFAETPSFASVHVRSVGTNAARAQHICDTVRSEGEVAGWARYNWMDFADKHRSAPITATKVAQAKLILTAGPEHRATVARIDPQARSRTFTLREALWLGEGFSTDAVGTAAVESFASYANANRGMRELPAKPRRVLPWKRPTGDVLSIADTHSAPVKEHRATILNVSDVATRLGTLLTSGVYAPT